MAHPYKSAGHRNDPKWLGSLKRASGGPAMRTSRGKAPDPADQDNANPSRFTGTHDFDNRAVGEVGPDLREAQTDELGLTRRGKEMRRGSDDQPAWFQDDQMPPQREDWGPRFKRGGRVRKRSIGGPVDDGPYDTDDGGTSNAASPRRTPDQPGVNMFLRKGDTQMDTDSDRDKPDFAGRTGRPDRKRGGKVR